MLQSPVEPLLEASIFSPTESPVAAGAGRSPGWSQCWRTAAGLGKNRGTDKLSSSELISLTPYLEIKHKTLLLQPNHLQIRTDIRHLSRLLN